MSKQNYNTNYKTYGDISQSSIMGNNSSTNPNKAVNNSNINSLEKSNKTQVNNKMAMIEGERHILEKSSFVSQLRDIEHLRNLCKNVNTITVVYVGAEWCQPCKKIFPKFEKLASDLPVCMFLKDDIDDKNTVHREKVSSVPSFFVYHRNNEKMFNGFEFDEMEIYVKDLNFKRK